MNNIKYLTSVFKSLADENRLQIVCELLNQESTVKDLSRVLHTPSYNISKNLKILEVSGLVNKKKDGNYRIYSITGKLRSCLSKDKQALDFGCCKLIFDDSNLNHQMQQKAI
jgi:DNA-binding transcriptional ArsR family regulator